MKLAVVDSRNLIRGIKAHSNIKGFEDCEVLFVDKNDSIWGVPVTAGTELTITSVTP